MAIMLADNLAINGKKQNVERDSFDTLQDMASFNENYLPDIFIATCKATGKLYIYNVDNTEDAVLGKWREVSSGGGGGGGNIVVSPTPPTQAQIDALSDGGLFVVYDTNSPYIPS